MVVNSSGCWQQSQRGAGGWSSSWCPRGACTNHQGCSERYGVDKEPQLHLGEVWKHSLRKRLSFKTSYKTRVWCMGRCSTALYRALFVPPEGPPKAPAFVKDVRNNPMPACANSSSLPLQNGQAAPEEGGNPPSKVKTPGLCGV